MAAFSSWKNSADGGFSHKTQYIGSTSEDMIMRWIGTNNEIMKDPNYKYGYYGNVNGTFGHEGLGLPSNQDWWFIIYIAHNNANGYGMQLAFQLAGPCGFMYQRNASGLTWQPWYVFTGTKV